MCLKALTEGLDPVIVDLPAGPSTAIPEVTHRTEHHGELVGMVRQPFGKRPGFDQQNWLVRSLGDWSIVCRELIAQDPDGHWAALCIRM
jgi:hypothetical protein